MNYQLHDYAIDSVILDNDDLITELFQYRFKTSPHEMCTGDVFLTLFRVCQRFESIVFPKI